ncbi:MAG: NUDIX domain-containing protein, partial [Spirochaetaceae bacterium]|nr:NUDIX domain-containing protein [Spirochaetaceae bacterium]
MAGRRSVAGIAVEGGRFFIAQRIPGGDLGGKWEFPGGKVEEGETDAEALIREYR